MFASNTSAVSADANYIESVFQSWLYTGNGSTQTITNGIDLAGKGGLVWLKNRGLSQNHLLVDTARSNAFLKTNTTDAQTSNSGYSFLSNGFSLTTLGNSNTYPFASWTFRKQPKFFDVVTYTGTGFVRTVAHNLGSAPGCIIVKAYSGTNAGIENWTVYHRSLGGTKALRLNTTGAELVADSFWNDTDPTATVFTVADNGAVNNNGLSYVAYLFAHDAGGFGLTGTDNVISCGSVSGFGTVVNLGFEPQWILMKQSNGTSDWIIADNMRGIATGGSDALLFANTGGAETSANDWIDLTSTGFVNNVGSGTFIYIAIRRGPMKTPTTGTSVFGLNARTGTGAIATVTGSAGVSDAVLIKNRGASVASLFSSRLTGTGYLVTSTTAAEVAAGTTILQANPWDVMDGVKVGTTSTITNASANTYINYLFDRAPGFFDEVCYTGDGTGSRSINHNLTVQPEFIIVKSRSATGQWVCFSKTGSQTYVIPNSAGASTFGLALTNAGFSYTDPAVNDFFTSTTFDPVALSFDSDTNVSGRTYVAYLFASCPGVSKVGSYTGDGTTDYSKIINCGFTSGVRFVLIKRTDSTGDWYVWDTARGIGFGAEPFLRLNSTAAEDDNTNSIQNNAVGFAVGQVGTTSINVNGAAYIFLAIA